MSALIPESGSSSVKSESRSRVREFHPSNIRFVQELGEGAFGKSPKIISVIIMKFLFLFSFQYIYVCIIVT
jgi:hypothetical protein